MGNVDTRCVDCIAQICILEEYVWDEKLSEDVMFWWMIGV